MGSLQRLLDDFPADAVFVDSLIELARRTTKEMPKAGDAAGWAAVVRPLSALAHERDVGLLTIHHARKSDGRYRDSTEIAAACDAIFDMLGPKGGDDPTLRRLEGVGRWEVGRWIARLVDGAYEFGGEIKHEGPAGEDDRIQALVPKIRAALSSGPACGKEALRRQLKVSQNHLYAALNIMEARGEIEVGTKGPGKAASITLLEAVKS
jgi:hypothetical protein